MSVSCFDLICFNLFFVTLKFSHFVVHVCLFQRLFFKSTDIVTDLFKFGFLYVSRSLAQAGY